MQHSCLAASHWCTHKRGALQCVCMCGAVYILLSSFCSCLKELYSEKDQLFPYIQREREVQTALVSEEASKGPFPPTATKINGIRSWVFPPTLYYCLPGCLLPCTLYIQFLLQRVVGWLPGCLVCVWHTQLLS